MLIIKLMGTDELKPCLILPSLNITLILIMPNGTIRRKTRVAQVPLMRLYKNVRTPFHWEASSVSIRVIRGVKKQLRETLCPLW